MDQPVSMAELNAADDNTSSTAVFGFAVRGRRHRVHRRFYCAYENIERLGASDLRASRGWSIGAWFVPILNLVRPEQLMDDIGARATRRCRRTSPAARGTAGAGPAA